MNSLCNHSFWRMLRLFGPLLIGSRQLTVRTLLTLFILVVDLAAVATAPKMLKAIVESLNMDFPQMMTVGLLLGGFTILWILSQITSYLMDMTFFPVINDAIKRLTARSVETMHTVSLLHNQRLDSAEVLSATSRIGLGARLFFKAVCLSVVPTIAKLILALALVWHLPGINICLLATLGLCLAVAYVLLPRYVQARKEAWAYTDARAVKMIDSLLNTKVVRFSFEPEMAKLSYYLEREAEGWQRAVYQGNALGISTAIVFGTSLGCILYLAISSKLYPLSEFVYLKTLLVGLFMQMRHTLTDLKQLGESYADVEVVLSLLELPGERETATARQELFSSSADAVLCRNVSFAYPTGKSVVEGLDLCVRHGQKVAIVGQNGTGKSTLLHLLAGLYRPHSGEITVAGVPSTQLPFIGISRGFCFLPQDVFLFNGTFYENLVYGIKRPLTNRVTEAIHAAGLESVVERLPQGLHTPLGEFGKVLSGGEKQRLALARAMIVKPNILVLDESLSSIDLEAEKKILTELCQLVPTIILVSHRPSVTDYCDVVYQLEDGKLCAIDSRRLALPSVDQCLA